MSRIFDAIIIGAGQAGPSLAGRFNDAGKTVALIERDELGGTCVNTGCTPTKALVASAKAAHMIRHAEEMGLPPQQLSAIDLAAIQRRKDAIVTRSRQGLEKWLEGMTLVLSSMAMLGLLVRTRLQSTPTCCRQSRYF